MRISYWSSDVCSSDLDEGAQTREHFTLACDHRFVIDNLMDLTHETYVHPETIGQNELMEAPVAARREADAAILERFMPDIDPPPYWAQMLGKPGRVDRWQVCRFILPSTVDRKSTSLNSSH